jgi:hypothetical protein
MAKILQGSVEAKRIYEFLIKALSTGDLTAYYLLIDKQGNEKALRVSLAHLLAFSGSVFYDDVFKLLSRADDDELTFSLASLTENRQLTVPDKNGTIALLDDIEDSFDDNDFEIFNNSDNTKLLKFLLSSITTGTTRTLTVPDVSGLMAVAGMLDAFQFGGQANGGYSVESFSATKTFDLNNGVSQEMVITGNITSLTLSNKVNGGSYLIFLVQNATGGYTIPTPDSTFGGKTDNSADFVTDANAVNIINVNVRPNGTTYYTVETYTP